MAFLDRGHFFWEKTGAESVGALNRPKTRGHKAPKKPEPMLLHVCLDLKKIAKLGRNYPWPRPSSCRCGNRMVWGHGFVQAYFIGFAHALEMRRYRCPLCGCVIRLRPKGYFPRIQTDRAGIREAIVFRLRLGVWPPGSRANRCRHWLFALKRNAVLMLGITWCNRLTAAFDRLVAMGCVPVLRTG
jgi:hypothetical protein